MDSNEEKASNPRGQGKIKLTVPRSLSMTINNLQGEALLSAIPRVTIDGNITPFLADIPLLAKLGEGAMGAVYWGYDPHLKKEVAVKLFRPASVADEEDGALGLRFRREARLAMSVTSPHLVKVYELLEDHGYLAMVMEYVKGKTAGEVLDAHFKKAGRGLSEKDALTICLAAAHGLGIAHENGIIHRDVKPDNILIPVKGDGTFDLSAAKVSDLGISKRDSSQSALTQTQVFMGSPGFMAPEQAEQFKEARQPADIFSLGATLYCLLSGRPPFSGRTPIATILNTVEKPHDSILTYCRDLGFPTVQVLDRCLEKDFTKRFANGSELASALADCLAQCGG